MLLVLFLAVAVNLFDRQIINILGQDIKQDLKLSDAELGLITGTAFGIFKAAISIPIAWWADRFDRAKMLTVLIAVWSGFTMICGVSTGFATLASARMAVGLGESGGVPVATALVRDHFTRRPTAALAVLSTGNPIGTLLAFLVGGMVAERWGWRAAFVVAGLPGLVIAFFVWSTVKDVRVERRPSTGAGTWLADVLALLRRPRLRPLLGATFASMFLVTAGNAWVPPFMMRVHGLSTGEMGLYGAIAIGVGGGLGSLSGALCESVREKISNAESALLLATMALAIPSMAATVLSPSVGGALTGFLIYNGMAYAWLAPTIRLIQDSAAADDHALAIAVCSAFAVFMSFGIGLPLVGWVSDLLAPTYGAHSVGLSLLALATCAVVVGFASHVVLLFRAVR